MAFYIDIINGNQKESQKAKSVMYIQKNSKIMKQESQFQQCNCILLITQKAISKTWRKKERNEGIKKDQKRNSKNKQESQKTNKENNKKIKLNCQIQIKLKFQLKMNLFYLYLWSEIMQKILKLWMISERNKYYESNNPKVVCVYENVAELMKTCKLTQPFHLIPKLENWKQVFELTKTLRMVSLSNFYLQLDQVFNKIKYQMFIYIMYQLKLLSHKHGSNQYCFHYVQRKILHQKKHKLYFKVAQLDFTGLIVIFKVLIEKNFSLPERIYLINIFLDIR
ncbi:unnamed protein product [Paramecium sonneborni]|uniref:Uncharacterized protein n=1 Tax=Paramecium sonneborni TaxID=65129 RepID=A0A8S1RKH6_9CILI|nr:unnamed protein product [Paramecium sonneborni]